MCNSATVDLIYCYCIAGVTLRSHTKLFSEIISKILDEHDPFLLPVDRIERAFHGFYEKIYHADARAVKIVELSRFLPFERRAHFLSQGTEKDCPFVFGLERIVRFHGTFRNEFRHHRWKRR